MPFGISLATLGKGTTIPPAPAPVSFGGTIAGAIKTYVDKGGLSGGKQAAQAAVQVGLAAVGTAVPAVGAALAVGEMLGFSVTDLMTTKSKANWRRTLGRIYRASVLGYVPDVSGGINVIRQLIAAWQQSGDASGAQFWDRVVAYFAVPTEKGGTKEGFTAGAPLGSKRAESTPGFSSGLTAFLAAVGV